MRRRGKLLAGALCLALCASGCVLRAAQEETQPPEGSYRVYFAAGDGQMGGASVGYEYRVPTEKPGWQGLVNLLLAGPESEELYTPFPRRTTCTGSLEEGCLHLDFSEQYGELSGIGLTMANACLALTLCQAEGVEGLYLTVEGEPLPAQCMPESNLLRAEDIVLSGYEEQPVSVDVTLWYPLADGSGLAERYRRLVITEDESLAQMLFKALAEPGEEALLPAVPSGGTVRSISTDRGICYLDLPVMPWGTMPEEGLLSRLMVYALVNTLCGNLEGVNGVQLQVEGEVRSNIGGVPAVMPIAPDFTGAQWTVPVEGVPPAGTAADPVAQQEEDPAQPAEIE